MNTETRSCKSCKADFVIDPDDSGFYEKVDVPPPTLCSECRYLRRLLDRNEWTMYKRTCDATGKQIVSIYRANAPFPVYEQEYWKSDAWDPLEYGREFDFSRPFFEQYEELRRSVPHLALVNSASVNSEYTNQANNNKDCYMQVTSDRCEKCMYGNWCQRSFMVGDCSMTDRSEFCFECMDVANCSNCAWCYTCSDCVSVYLSYDCRGCSDCFGCVGLRNKRYHWLNENVGKEEYEKRLKGSGLGRGFLEESFQKFLDLQLRIPVKFYHGTQNNDSSGDYIENTERARSVFNCRDNKDTAYMQDAWLKTQDCRDCTEIIVGQLSYEVQGVDSPHRSMFVRSCFNSVTDSCYCDMCFGVSDCFGCFGLKKNQYCALNMQYSKNEYMDLKKRIVAHMRSTGEWGEYFPAHVSPFAYNESTAQDYFPLTKEEALRRGYSWYDRPEPAYDITLVCEDLPETIADTNDSILEQTIQCRTQTEVEKNPMCAKAFRLVPLEFQLYRQLGVPVPDRCFTCRRARRFTFRNPRRLWERNCECAGESSKRSDYKNRKKHFHDSGPCPNKFQTTYAPDRKEIVYCEGCYNAEMV